MTKQEINDLVDAWNNLVSSDFYDPMDFGSQTFRKITPKDREALDPFFFSPYERKLKVGEVEFVDKGFLQVREVVERQPDGLALAHYVSIDSEDMGMLHHVVRRLAFMYGNHQSPKRERLLKKEESS